MRAVLRHIMGREVAVPASSWRRMRALSKKLPAMYDRAKKGRKTNMKKRSENTILPWKSLQINMLMLGYGSCVEQGGGLYDKPPAGPCLIVPQAVCKITLLFPNGQIFRDLISTTFHHRRVVQVQLASAKLAICLKNSVFGFEKLSFFLGLRLSFFATFFTYWSGMLLKFDFLGIY